MIKKIGIAILIVAAIGATVAYKMWTKPHEGVGAATLTVTAPNLMAQYNQNEKDADATYLNKTIDVSGKIKDVNKDSSGVSLTLETGDEMSTVSCTLDKFAKQPREDYAIGEEVIMKGVCLGKNSFDINIDRCVPAK